MPRLSANEILHIDTASTNIIKQIMFRYNNRLAKTEIIQYSLEINQQIAQFLVCGLELFLLLLSYSVDVK